MAIVSYEIYFTINTYISNSYSTALDSIILRKNTSLSLSPRFNIHHLLYCCSEDCSFLDGVLISSNQSMISKKETLVHYEFKMQIKYPVFFPFLPSTSFLG